MIQKSRTDQDIMVAWKKMSEQKFSHSKIKKEEIMDAITNESNHAIGRLKNTILMKVYWCLFFIALLTIALVLTWGKLITSYALGTGIFIYMIGLFPMLYKYFDLKEEGPVFDSILMSMKHEHKMIRSALRMETIWGMFFLPVCLILGFISGLDSTGEFVCRISEPKILFLLITILCVGTPLLYLLTEKMNKKAYGAEMKKLESNIAKMEVFA
ncbi:MAG: hypothetical protein P8M34_02325 [Saprospiraceae bacterium]|nr:hypothetical protein [Saprospiraceae bacterium]|tara:strand:+ start:967 stop:1605 length:639 start_codon:yes stop_codon:yes gene_type:complete